MGPYGAFDPIITSKTGNAPTRDPHITSDYIHGLSRELSRLATEAGLDLLAYLLDMVRLEADLVARQTAAPRPKPRP